MGEDEFLLNRAHTTTVVAVEKCCYYTLVRENTTARGRVMWNSSLCLCLCPSPHAWPCFRARACVCVCVCGADEGAGGRPHQHPPGRSFRAAGGPRTGTRTVSRHRSALPCSLPCRVPCAVARPAFLTHLTHPPHPPPLPALTVRGQLLYESQRLRTAKRRQVRRPHRTHAQQRDEADHALYPRHSLTRTTCPIRFPAQRKRATFMDELKTLLGYPPSAVSPGPAGRTASPVACHLTP